MEMQTPDDRGIAPEDDLECARTLVQLLDTLEPTQYCTMYFLHWKRREKILEILNTRYQDADLRKLELGMFH
jgi:hypothetical protein